VLAFVALAAPAGAPLGDLRELGDSPGAEVEAAEPSTRNGTDSRGTPETSAPDRARGSLRPDPATPIPPRVREVAGPVDPPEPSREPSQQPQPSERPSQQPEPTPGGRPTTTPSGPAADTPGRGPSDAPSGRPDDVPTGKPSDKPVGQPSNAPGRPTDKPSGGPGGPG
jgi:hypothetical protein